MKSFYIFGNNCLTDVRFSRYENEKSKYLRLISCQWMYYVIVTLLENLQIGNFPLIHLLCVKYSWLKTKIRYRNNRFYFGKKIRFICIVNSNELHVPKELVNFNTTYSFTMKKFFLYLHQQKCNISISGKLMKIKIIFS